MHEANEEDQTPLEDVLASTVWPYVAESVQSGEVAFLRRRGEHNPKDHTLIKRLIFIEQDSRRKCG